MHVLRVVKELLEDFFVNSAAFGLLPGVVGVMRGDIHCFPGNAVWVTKGVTPDLNRVKRQPLQESRQFDY